MGLFSFLGGTRYAYEVGNIVRLKGGTRWYDIRWRGYLVLGPPGQRRRQPVYWLGEEFGDECYFEDELGTLGELPF